MTDEEINKKFVELWTSHRIEVEALAADTNRLREALMEVIDATALDPAARNRVKQSIAAVGKPFI